MVIKWGDVVLKKVANVLSSNAQEGEFVARFGGEEFVDLVIRILQSTRLKISLRRCLRKWRRLLLIESLLLSLLVLAIFELSSGETRNERMSVLDSLIKVADECLYVAKQNGRDQFVSRPYFQYLDA